MHAGGAVVARGARARLRMPSHAWTRAQRGVTPCPPRPPARTPRARPTCRKDPHGAVGARARAARGARVRPCACVGAARAPAATAAPRRAALCRPRGLSRRPRGVRPSSRALRGAACVAGWRRLSSRGACGGGAGFGFGGLTCDGWDEWDAVCGAGAGPRANAVVWGTRPPRRDPTQPQQPRPPGAFHSWTPYGAPRDLWSPVGGASRRAGAWRGRASRAPSRGPPDGQRRLRRRRDAGVRVGVRLLWRRRQRRPRFRAPRARRARCRGGVDGERRGRRGGLLRRQAPTRRGCARAGAHAG
jgi:hypothetical protein